MTLPDAVNRRRSTRVVLNVSLLLHETDANGQAQTITAMTIMVSKHGARVHTGRHLVRAKEITISIPKTGRRQRARVVMAWEQLPGSYECAIEQEHPENLWGVSFPPENWFKREEPQPAIEHGSPQGPNEGYLGSSV